MLTIYENVKGNSYKQLIHYLSQHCNRFAFVENREIMEIEEDRIAYVDQLIMDIKGHLLDRKVQRKWETTRLSGGTAYVYYFQFNYATKQFFIEYSQSLFYWISPKLPEDLMFYQDEKCVLAVCSHEGYFNVDQALWNQFQK
ncbi:stage III sporulation protein AH [Bacillus pinisoli]|uniref:stage III sporulation protein AH n=1 Tax=Bacillus pinisoli TaxID=2901866 RepID=UPI001FF584C8|nr:stage III sporulation protein AH [Bacillus pinisoli]